MLNIAIIGIGNAGNQVAQLAKDTYNIPGLAINSSERDTATIKSIDTIIVGDEKGAGKDRNTAKEFIRDGVKELLSGSELKDVVNNNEVIFVVSSTGGGTGSGMAPVLTDILGKVYPKKQFILVGVLPPIAESIAAQQNTLEYLKELKQQEPVYMLYDNNNFANLPTSDMMKTVNKEIVEDMVVIRGDYQLSTPYNSIDEKDMMRIIETSGRIHISRLVGVKEKDIDVKSIEDRLVSVIKANAHAETDRDKIVKRQGLIINLNEKLYKSLDNNLVLVKDLMGEAIEGFEHIYLDDSVESRVINVLSGLSVPDDRIEKILQRIEEVKEALMKTKDTSVLDGTDTGDLDTLRRGNSKEANVQKEVDLDNIFNNYM